jgi:hypothetical protein
MIPCAFVLACGPSAGVSDDTTSSADATTNVTDGGVDATTSTADGTSGALDTSGMTSAATTTTTGGELLDPCLVFEPPDCGSECTTITAYGPGDGACGVDATPNGLRTFCASLGEPVADTYRSTFFAEIDGVTWVAFTNQPCIESLSGMPVAWNECSGAAGEPEVCTCGCAHDVCGWEAEADLLVGCGLPTPCQTIDPGLPSAEDRICVLTALRDRTPSVLTVYPESAKYEHRVYVDGVGAQHLRRVFGGICTGPFVATWQPSQLCELQPPAYFDACLQATARDQIACMNPNDWFESCAETPAFCP